MRPPATLLPTLCALCALAGRLCGAGMALELPALAVEHGGSRLLTCWSACPEPGASGDPEPGLSPGPQERPENDSEWSSRLLCFLNCNGIQKNIPADLVTYHAPEQRPVLWLQEGNWSCPAVAPERNLSVMLDCGNETFPDTEPLSCGSSGSRPSVTCTPELRLGPRGPRLRGDATLALYNFPSDPELEAERHLEVTERAKVTCSVGGAFPAPRLALSMDGVPLAAAGSADGRRAVAELPPRSRGSRELLCVGRVGPRERRAGTTIRVHSLSKPRMEMEAERLEGDTVTLTAGEGLRMICTASAEPAARLRLRLLNGTAGGFPLTLWKQRQLLPFNLSAREEYDGAGIVCDAELPTDERTLRQSSDSIRLNIHYGPRLDEAGCPAEQHWTEGREAALRCAARGNPPPRVECARDGGSFPVDEPQVAAPAHGGSYRCRAVNELGEAERDVKVHVEVSDFPVLLVTLLVAAVVAAVAAAGATYRIYYRKKKIRRYKLQEQQRRLQLQPLAGPSPAPPAPNGSAAAPNGSAAGPEGAEPLPP